MLRFILCAAVLFSSLAEANAQAIALSLVGRTNPSPRKLEFFDWTSTLINRVLTVCPVTRTTTLYFDDAAGNDSTGDGTIGTPYKTIAKAQTELGAWSVSSGGLALLFKRGVEWEETTGLTINKSYVTVGAYGTGARPLFNWFSTWTVDGVNDWALGGAANRFERTSVTQISVIREAGNRLKVYRKVATAADCESTPNSWYQTGTTLSVHATNAAGASAIDPDTIAWEYVLDSVANDSGVDIATDVTSVRVDGIRADGWGYDSSGSVQEYGIISRANGTNIHAITDCEAYHNTRHNIGHNGGAGAGAGGLCLVMGCTMGGFRDAADTAWVGYCGDGEQEELLIGNTFVLGATPSVIATDTASGAAGIVHTDAGAGDNPSLVIAMDNVIVNRDVTSSTWALMGHDLGHAIGLHFNNMATVASADECKAIQIGTVMQPGKGVGVGHSPFIPGTFEANGFYQFRPVNASNDSLVSMPNPLPTGWMANTFVQIDCSPSYYTETFGGWYNVVTATNVRAPHQWHNHIRVIGSNRTGTYMSWTMDYLNCFNSAPSFTGSAGSEFANSIFDVVRGNSGTNDAIRSGYPDSATYIRNNAFFSHSADSGLLTIASAANTVTLAGRPTPLVQSLTGAGQLYGTGEAGLIEYDFYKRRRPKTGATSIGPVEYIRSGSSGGVTSPTTGGTAGN